MSKLSSTVSSIPNSFDLAFAYENAAWADKHKSYVRVIADAGRVELFESGDAAAAESARSHFGPSNATSGLGGLALTAEDIRDVTAGLGQAVGPRADALRAMVATTMADGRATSAALMRLIREVRARRDVVGRELQGLDPEEPVSLVDRRG